jgi:hypothetical protein
MARPASMSSSESIAELRQATGLSKHQLRRWLAKAQSRFNTLLMVATKNYELHLWLQKWADVLQCDPFEHGVDLATVASRIGLSLVVLTRYLVETRTIRTMLQAVVPRCLLPPNSSLPAYAMWWASLPARPHLEGEPSTPLVEVDQPPNSD